jgi:hypothetical protein
MQSFDENEMQDELKSLKGSTKLTLLACYVLLLVGLTVLAVKGQYVEVDQAVASPPEASNGSFAISQTQPNR